MNTTEKLAAALRDLLQTALSRGEKLGLDAGGPVLDNARAALAEYEASPSAMTRPADPLRWMILRDALSDYGSGQWLQSQALRAGKIYTDQSKETRETFAQGCDVRRRTADAMRQEIDA